MFSEGVCHGDELFLLFKLNAIPMDPANAKDKQVAGRLKTQENDASFSRLWSFATPRPLGFHF